MAGAEPGVRVWSGEATHAGIPRRRDVTSWVAARAVVAHIEEREWGRPIPPPGFPDMDAAYLALFRRRPETVAMARRLLELPRPPTAVDLDERGDPIVSPEEEEYFRLSGVLMAAVRGRPEPGIQAVVYQIPGPQLLGRAAVQLIRAFDAATSVVAGIHRPVTDRIVMGRRNRQR